jgi:dTDP-4-amino-4,6-dideoxygalactose transaminase
MDAVLSCLAEDRIGPGEQAKNLVSLAKEKIGFDYAIALRSPANALRYALEALNLEDGSGVAISPLSPAYYVDVIQAMRLQPVFADIAEGTCVLSAETLQKTINSSTKAIVVHYTLGYIPNMDEICGLGLPVIEDISCSFGSTMLAGEEKLPFKSNALFTILGLEERDMLTAGGGALLSANARRDASVLRGIKVLNEFALPDMNAAMAFIQLKESAKNLQKRADIAESYIRSALRTRHKRLAAASDTVEYNNYCFSLVLETGMKDVEAYARKKDIVVENAFTGSIAASAFANAASASGNADEGLADTLRAACPAACSIALRTVIFPLYPRLSGTEAEKVGKLILTLP